MKHLKWLGGLAAMALLMSKPQAAASGAAGAMAHWYRSVAPALFPFLALMPLLTCEAAIGAYRSLLAGPMGLFNLPGAAAPGVIVGMTAGTPAGAMTAREIAARAGMSRGQLQRLAAATAGFSPAFLVGGIGAGVLNSAGTGWRLLGAQLLTQLTLMALLRRCWEDRTEAVELTEAGSTERPIRGAVLAVLTICGYMALFGALAAVLAQWLGRVPADALLCLLDVPSGALRLSGMALPEAAKGAVLAGMCGFGGMCVIAQSLGALKGCGVSAGEYVGVRVLAGLLCAGYMALLQGLPIPRKMAWIEPVRDKPLAAGMLIAAILTGPVVMKSLYKSVNNK